LLRVHISLLLLLLPLLCRVLLPYEGCDVLQKFTPRPAMLAVHLLDVSQPKVKAHVHL
jgi:hypothetical protein